METIPRREFLGMKGEGHLGEKRDKTVYFTRLRCQGVYIVSGSQPASSSVISLPVTQLVGQSISGSVIHCQ